jgi:hypothetical protein
VIPNSVRNSSVYEIHTSRVANLPRSETSKTDRQTSTELDETSVEREVLSQVVGDQNRHDKTVDTNNTRHDNGDNVCDLSKQAISARLRRERDPICDWSDSLVEVDVLLTIRSGRRTAMEQTPTPALAVPYAAPKQVKTIAEVQPSAPKKGCEKDISLTSMQ